MAAGKSLCLKLLKFFEDIIPDLFCLPYSSFYNNLNIDNMYNNLKNKFCNIFYFYRSNDKKPIQYNVTYTFSSKKNNFIMNISGSTGMDTEFKCDYLEKMLDKWKQKFYNDENLKPESVSVEYFLDVKHKFYRDMLKEFRYLFPLKTIFIPASRAVLLSSSSYNDEYLSDYSFFLRFLPRYKSNELPTDKILKAKIVYNDDSYLLESADGRRISLGLGSSGQQEIATILLLLDKLGNFDYTYGIKKSLIIDGLSAHIFPTDQKEFIELIVNVYKKLKEKDKDKTPQTRFFITIHSPIILDCLNNMLKKGILLINHKDIRNDIEKLDIPSLHPNEFSAIFIKQDGSMQDIFATEEKIEVKEITELFKKIDDDKQKLSEFDKKY